MQLASCVAGMLALAACSEPTVRGTVLPSAAERDVVPWISVDVRLVRGELTERLSQLASEYRNEAGPRAAEHARVLLEAERAAKTDLLRDARAALASTDFGAGGFDALASGADGPPLRACLSAAESLLAARHRDYDDLLQTIAPRLAAIGVAAKTPAEAIPALRAAVQAKLAVETRRLRDQYLQSDLSQQSRTVLSPGAGMDRLCWKAQNRRGAGLQFRGIVVSLDGKALPDDVARQIWRLPPQGQKLRIPNDQAADADVLLPEAEFETCFYARGKTLPSAFAETYGLAPSSPTRGREWRVQWQDISLVANASTARTDGPAKLFFRELKEAEAGLEETRLIDAITRSPAADGLAQAERALLACHRAIETEQSEREVERSLSAVREGRIDDVAAQVRLRPILRQDLHDPAIVEEWMTKARGLVNDDVVARQQVDVGHAFELAKLAAGEYTLVAESKPAGVHPKIWVLPLHVDGAVERDLEIATSRGKTLDQMLQEALALGAGRT